MWFDSLALFEQIVFVISCIGSGLLVVQFVLLVFGLSDLLGVDIDFGAGEGVGFFTVQGFMAFLTLGGWTAFSCSLAGLPWWGAALLGVAVGALGMLGIAWLYKLMGKFQSDGTLDMKNGIGMKAEVYLKIPEKSGGAGKITMTVQGRLIEADAVTDSAEPIKTGEFVKVLDYSNGKYTVEKEI